MARYIDADRLIDYIDENVVCTSSDSEECKQFMIEHLAMEWFAPTADVVPKSEVMKLVGERYDKCDACRTKCTKAVAREIFEEIENKLTEDIKDILERVNSITDPDAIDGQYTEIATLEDVLYLLAELKKKYTEEGK